MANMHHKVARAFEEIDAAVFNGDTFDDPDNRSNAILYLQRWRDRFGAMQVEDDAADDKSTIVVPTRDIVGELRESLRAVLHSHDFVVAHGVTGRQIDAVRFESFVDEAGKNGAQRIHMLAINHELDAQEKPSDWSPHVRDLEQRVERGDWIGAIRVLARMTVQCAIKADEESPR